MFQKQVKTYIRVATNINEFHLHINLNIYLYQSVTVEINFQKEMFFMKVSEITEFLEGAYHILNDRYFGGELPPVVITIQSSPRAYGHYTPFNSWKDNNDKYREINIGAESLSRYLPETLATLVHEMTHHYCAVVSKQKDTSRSGTYHNKIFKQVAEGTGAILIGYDPRIGYSITSPSPELIAFVEEQGWQDIDLSRKEEFEYIGGSGGSGVAGTAGVAGKKKNNSRKYQCPICSTSVRATKDVNIICGDCDCKMELVEK